MRPGLDSAIYEGRVRHRRFEPIEREFSQRIFMLYLDLDELPEVMAIHPLWSTRRRSPARFRRADYLGPAERPLKRAVADLVERRTGRRPDGPIRMLTHLRYWGRIENPVTFYYCFDPAGELRTVVAEVTNTPWRDRHAYVIDGPADQSGVISAKAPKAMHVSPLMGMDHEYELRFGTPGVSMPVHITSRRGDERYFDATLNLERHAISRRKLARLFFEYPPMSFAVIAGIHLQAAASWAKGARFHRRPAAGDLRNPAGAAKLCPVSAHPRESSAEQSGNVA
ncbi:MAG TPA: DUF1365 domain-containing protein [Solirubrobacterales bacterium]|nr:DUF1365 domain-containing protein [Solirubrobacterales bacterium]